MSKSVNKFEEVARTILADYKDTFVKEFQAVDAGKNATFLVKLQKEILSGESTNTEFFITSPTYNEALYNLLPEFIKERITKNPDKIYVIFLGWDGLVASYLLIKDYVVRNN